MATDLQSSLDGLLAELQGAGTRLQEARGRAQTAAAAVDELRQRVLADSARLDPVALALQARLQQGQGELEAATGRLETDLGALDAQVRERTRSTEDRVRRMLEAVRLLRADLQRLQEELHAEATRTAALLAAATERAVGAVAAARQGIAGLDAFVRDDFAPRLAAHEAAMASEHERLTRSVREAFVPALQGRVADLQRLLAQAAEEIRLRAADVGSDARTRADEALGSLETATRQEGEDLARRTDESAAALGEAVAFVQERLHEEETREVALLEAASTAVPNLKDLEGIPVRLQETLRKARVLR